MATIEQIPQPDYRQRSSLRQRVTVVHSGARDAYQVAIAMQEAGMLDTLVTDLFWPADRRLAQHLFPHLPLGIQAQLSSRNEQKLPSSYVKLCAMYGMATLLLDRIPGVPQSMRRSMMRKADAHLGRTAGRYAERNQSALLSYSYYAHDAFRAYRGDGILFQLHPHPASMRRILLQELAAHPQCSASLQQEWELALPESDFQHLVSEPLQARYILAASSFTRDTLVENGSRREDIEVIPYGVDSHHFFPDLRRIPKAGGKLKLLFVGRINQRKGIQYLLDALRLVGSDRVELTVCGRVVDDLQIFNAFSNVTIRPNVTSLELVTAYQDADLFVFPSVAEGFGQVLLEALASGLPILTTTRTAAPDLIESGRQGFIVDPGSPEQLATHIEWAISHPQALEAMRTEARYVAQQFTWRRFRLSIAAGVAGFLENANARNADPQPGERRYRHAF